MSAARGAARPPARANASFGGRGAQARASTRGGGGGGNKPNNSGQATAGTAQQKRGGGPLQSIHSGNNRGQGRGGSASRGSRRPTAPKPAAAPKTATTDMVAGRDPTQAGGQAQYMRTMTELWQRLKDRREDERRQAIRSGLMADPDKKTSLAEAITPVGTCTDMCPEYERVERVVQQMVDRCERRETPSGSLVPWEPAMVKRFRRSAAGTDAQIPSDIRPPLVLQRTLDYLLDELVGGPRGLAAVHKFVWDRTRAIRNDFSIQQVTRPEDLTLAIECFERIARFHLLSLHQLSRPGIDAGEFDAHQEREQLGNTLLSLMYYYEDSRGAVPAPNEPEFRAYCVVFEIQDRRPDILDRVHAWPRDVLRHPKVQTALRLYAAATNTGDDQGPLLPRAAFALAQDNPGRFWAALASPSVSYLAACAAEVYFTHVRSGLLREVYRAYRRPSSAKMDDLTLDVLMHMMGFDNEEETQTFVEEHGFSVKERDDGEAYIDLNSIGGRMPADRKQNRGQPFSRRIVERKRHGRTLPAVIRGYTVGRARNEGLIEEDAEVMQDTNLFISDEEDPPSAKATKNNNTASIFSVPTTAKSNPFAQPQPSPFQTAVPAPSTQQPATFGVNPFAAAAQKLEANASGMASGQNPFPTALGSGTAVKSPFVSTDNPLQNTGAPTQSPFSTAAPGLGQSAQNPFSSNAQTLSKPPQASGTPETAAKSPFLPLSNQQIAASVFGSKSESTSFNLGGFNQVGKGQNKEAASGASVATATAPSPPQNPFATKTVETNTQGESAFTTQPNPGLFQFPTPSTASPSTKSEAPSLFSTFQNPPAPDAANLNENSPLTSPPPLGTSSSENGTSVTPQPNISSSTLPLDSTKQPPRSLHESVLQPPPQSPGFPPQTHQPLTATSVAPPSSLKRPSPTPPPAPKGPSAAEKSQAYDALALKMFIGQGGILEMFVETLMPEIVIKAHRKVERERERATVARAREFLLGTKYFRRWKQTAHHRVLARTGRERRRAMAQTLRQSLNSTPRSSMSPVQRPADSFFASNLSSSLSALPAPRSNSATSHNEAWGTVPQLRASTASSRRSSANAMPPPPSPLQSSKTAMFKIPASPAHHRRSQTVGSGSGLSNSVQGGRVSKYGALASPTSSTFRDRSLQSRALGDPGLLKRARRLISGRTDTTQTDYFRLKALGVDPDTPLVPQTRKRPHSIMSSEDGDERHAWSIASSTTNNSRAPSVSRMRSLTETGATRGREPSATPTRQAPPSAEEEELFARVRRVRLEMAESEAWFRSAREKGEKELSESGSVVAADAIRPDSAMSSVRHHARSGASTPSRTAVRLQETGAKGLWARWQQMVSEKEARSREQSESAPRGQSEAVDLVDDESGDDAEVDDMDYEEDGAEDDEDYEDEEDEDDDDERMAVESSRMRGAKAGFGANVNGFGQSGASIEDAIEL